MGCSQRIRRRKATADRMYAALDLHEKSIQAVLKDDLGRVVRASKMGKDEDRILDFLDGAGSFVLASTTASGKTFVAEVAAVDTIRKGKKAVYLVPLRALAGEKSEYFSQLKDVRVETRTGDYDRDESELADADLIIATYQKFDSMVRHSPGWLRQVGLVIADEGHEVPDQENGSTIEILLTRLKGMGVRVLVLSAVMPNVEEVARWLGAGYVKSDWRPVPLSKGVYSDAGSEALHRCDLTTLSKTSSERLYPSCRRHGCIRYRQGRIAFLDGTVRKVPRATDSSICDLALDTVRQGGQALVFARSRKDSVGFAESLRPHLSALLKDDERRGLERIAARASKVGPDFETSSRLASCIRSGSAFHNAGMARELRGMVEDGFRDRLVKVISSTPTLAAGINTPARRVIVQSVSRWTPAGWGEIPRWEAENMLGRAGRPGYDPFGEAILVATSHTSAEDLLDYLKRPIESIDSKLIYQPSFYSHVLSEVCLSRSPTEDSILDLFSGTFYAAQKGGRESVRNHVREALDFLLRYDLVDKKGVGFEPTAIGERVSKLYISPLSYPYIRNALSHAGRQPFPLAYLQLVASLPDWGCRPPTVDDRVYDELIGEFGADGVVLDPKDDKGGELRKKDASLNSAYVLMAWIEEKQAPEFYKRCGIGEGDFYTMKETADWLLFAVREIARMEGRSEVLPKLDRLIRRMRKGVKEELLDICSVKGVGRVTGRRLYNQGIRTAAEYRAHVEGADRPDAYTDSV